MAPVQGRRLGSQGLEVSALGLGCMGMSAFYGPPDAAEAKATIHRALELGVNFLDTSDVYGPHTNEVLVGRAIADRRDQVVLATKFGVVRDPDNPRIRGVNGRPEYVKQAAEASLKRLGTDYIDLYYQHRVDPDTPIEETVGALAELVQEGKIRHIGLSEAGPETLRRANAVHQITALQTEYSLWAREPEVVASINGERVNRAFLPGVALAASIRATGSLGDLAECDALLVVGTSGVVQPAAGLPRLVKQRHKPVIELNPAASAITPMADVFWETTAAEGLPQLVAGLQGSGAPAEAR